MRIPPDILAAVFDHASGEYPIEACGVLAGTDVPSAWWSLRNAARSSRRYTLYPREQLDVWAAIDAAGLDPLVVVHSHPFGRPEPSTTDIAEAPPVPTLHLIVGMGDGTPTARLWRIEDGQATEEPIT
ncbi:MAG TPA: M67 family metallopeptidase [Rugosimonospora sp.]|nr:M67 family metallopeptidase [Rugosimonospora sp.]